MNNLLFIYLVIINLLSFILMGIDKYKAIKKENRISEKNLLETSLLGGSLGTLLGMFIFRHKIRKKKFYILVPLIIIIQFIIYKKISL